MRQLQSTCRTISAVAVVLAPILTGCASSAEPTADPAAPPAQPETFTRTIVRMTGNGTPTSKVATITRAQQQQEIAARTAAHQKGEFTADTLSPASCTLAAFWAFDATGFTGNEICFYNGGTSADVGDLATFYRSICFVRGIPHSCDPWFESGTNEIMSWIIGAQGVCFNGSGSSTYGQPFMDIGEDSTFPDDSGVENWDVSNPGGHRSEYSSLEYIWLDYDTREIYNVCNN